MPLDYKSGDLIPFGERDFLYGLDTGQLKPRYYFFTNFIKPKGIWTSHNLDSHKIDCLTQGLGPTVPQSAANKLGKGPWQPTGKTQLSPKSALPLNWMTLSNKGNFRDQDRIDFIHWISGGRYSPSLSALPHQWNARFKRTSKAGLFWALFVKGYQIHFVVSPDLDYTDVVIGSSSHGLHEKQGKYESRYPLDLAGSTTVEVEEKRITYAELRWVYRYKDYDSVAQGVQFWEANKSNCQEFTAIPAPWLQPKWSKVWAGYVPKYEAKADDLMTATLQAIEKGTFVPPVGPEPIYVTSDQYTLQVVGQTKPTSIVVTPQVLPSTPQVLPSTPQVLPSTPQVLPSTPQVLPSTPQVLPSTPQVTQPLIITTPMTISSPSKPGKKIFCSIGTSLMHSYKPAPPIGGSKGISRSIFNAALFLDKMASDIDWSFLLNTLENDYTLCSDRCLQAYKFQTGTPKPSSGTYADYKNILSTKLECLVPTRRDIVPTQLITAALTVARQGVTDKIPGVSGVTNSSGRAAKSQMDAIVAYMLEEPVCTALGWPLFSVCDCNCFHNWAYLLGKYALDHGMKGKDANAPLLVLNIDQHMDWGTSGTLVVPSDGWGCPMSSNYKNLAYISIGSGGVGATNQQYFMHKAGALNDADIKIDTTDITTNLETQTTKDKFMQLWDTMLGIADKFEYVFLTIDRDCMKNNYTEWKDSKSIFANYEQVATLVEILLETLPVGTKLAGFDVTGLPEVKGELNASFSMFPANAEPVLTGMKTELERYYDIFVEYAGETKTTAIARPKKIVPPITVMETPQVTSIPLVASPKTPVISPKTPAISPKTPAISPKTPAISPKTPAISPKPATPPQTQPQITTSPSSAEIKVGKQYRVLKINRGFQVGDILTVAKIIGMEIQLKKDNKFAWYKKDQITDTNTFQPLT